MNSMIEVSHTLITQSQGEKATLEMEKINLNNEIRYLGNKNKNSEHLDKDLMKRSCDLLQEANKVRKKHKCMRMVSWWPFGFEPLRFSNSLPGPFSDPFSTIKKITRHLHQFSVLILIIFAPIVRIPYVLI